MFQRRSLNLLFACALILGSVNVSAQARTTSIADFERRVALVDGVVARAIYQYTETVSVQARRLRVTPTAGSGIACDDDTVRNAISAAADGDTITCAAGTYSWDAPVNAGTKAITLQGQGIGNTIITVDTTDSLLSFDANAGKRSRVTGFEFRDGSYVCASSCYLIQFAGPDSATPSTWRFRFDHNKIDHITTAGPGQLVAYIDPKFAYGLIDNNTILTSGLVIPIYTLAAGAYVFTDARWAAASDFGAETFVFIEANTITYDSGSHYLCADSNGGARIVYRYNVFTRCWIEAHGTESAGRLRGTRAIEVYNNTFTSSDGGFGIVGIRSGAALIYNNTATGFLTPVAAQLNAERNFSIFGPWGIVDGRNAWDVLGGSNPLTTGTASINSVGTTVQVAGTPWGVNDYAGRTVHKTTKPCYIPISAVNTGNERFTVTGHNLSTGNHVMVVNHTGSTPTITGATNYVVTVVDAYTVTLDGLNVTVAGSGGYLTKYYDGFNVCASQILSNTNNTLTYTGNGGFANSTDLSFTAGETFEIMEVTATFDAPGRGGGTNLNGVDLPTTPANDQSFDPVYQWLNTEDAANIAIGVSQVLQLAANVSYYDYTASFTGAAGIGTGARASRPATCTTGVAWWATDLSVLDKCTGTNTWTNAFYTPYTYPYPWP